MDDRVASSHEPTNCPVCRSPSVFFATAPNWGEWRVCESCSLEFVSPLTLAERPEQLYDEAYRGLRRESAMHHFRDRVRQREVLVRHDPTLWFWSPAFDRILTWLSLRVPAGGTVLEIGAGLGFFLHTMRRAGFDAVGLDVAALPVELARQDGFRVWHGELETMPDGWVDPDAIVAFFMLHHLVDPARFLATIRKRWPEAPLGVAQYGPSNRHVNASQPPRTLTRWNAPSLRTALENAGYAAYVEELSGTGNERRVLLPIRKVAKRAIIAPAVYRTFRRIEHRVIGRLLRGMGRKAYSLIAFAETRTR